MRTIREIRLGNTELAVPSVVVGCMRIADLSQQEMDRFLHSAVENGACYFDHADIYGSGRCEALFGKTLKESSVKREDILLQSKCGIRVQEQCYDLSKKHIIEAVEGSLKRLGTDHLDVLLLHRPDALTEPEEVAAAFDELETSGKVLRFGVSNHKPMQIELLKKYVKQELIINQLQLSIPVSNMIANGMEVNMTSDGAMDRDGSVLDYSRLHDMTIQAWSPFQMPEWKGCFLGSEQYEELNRVLEEMAKSYGVTKTTIATAWILRHPAKMQVVTGTVKESRLQEILDAWSIELSREEWYRLYLAGGHILP